MDDPILAEVARVIADRNDIPVDQVVGDIEHVGGPEWLRTFIWPAIDRAEEALYPRLMPVA